VKGLVDETEGGGNRNEKRTLWRLFLNARQIARVRTWRERGRIELEKQRRGVKHIGKGIEAQET